MCEGGLFVRALFQGAPCHLIKDLPDNQSNTADSSSLAARVEALESALAAPGAPAASSLTATAPAASPSAAAAAATAKALARAEYRILHLVQGLEAATARAEAAEKRLAELDAARSGPAASR